MKNKKIIEEFREKFHLWGGDTEDIEAFLLKALVQQKKEIKGVIREIWPLIRDAKRAGTSMSRHWHKIDEINQALTDILKEIDKHGK